MINNFQVMIICYSLFCFSDFLTDLEKRKMIGIAMIALISFYVLFNLTFITAASVSKMKAAYRKRKYQLKVKQVKAKMLNKQKDDFKDHMSLVKRRITLRSNLK